MHSTNIALRLAQEHRQRQIAEATEHRLGRHARGVADRGSIRRFVGRSLIRAGHALAAEPEPTLQPVRPR
jgi:hypothetical protein